VAMLPRRCAITEIANRRLVAVPVTGVSRRRQVMVVCRRQHRSHAADAFLSVAQNVNDTKGATDTKDTKGTKDTK
jgi:DNA-binding transcriptional LysR family regulator